MAGTGTGAAQYRHDQKRPTDLRRSACASVGMAMTDLRQRRGADLPAQHIGPPPLSHTPPCGSRGHCSQQVSRSARRTSARSSSPFCYSLAELWGGRNAVASGGEPTTTRASTLPHQCHNGAPMGAWRGMGGLPGVGGGGGAVGGTSGGQRVAHADCAQVTAKSVCTGDVIRDLEPPLHAPPPPQGRRFSPTPGGGGADTTQQSPEFSWANGTGGGGMGKGGGMDKGGGGAQGKVWLSYNNVWCSNVTSTAPAIIIANKLPNRRHARTHTPPHT